MNQCCPDNCKLKVKLAGETQDVSFEQPVESVEFSNGKCQRPHFPNYKGVIIGALIGSLACFGILKFSNHQVIDALLYRCKPACEEIRQLQSTNRIYSLKLANEGWHWINGVWVDRSVTKLSPKPQEPYK